jgi:membrane-bound lytic murein transglycosylase B
MQTRRTILAAAVAAAASAPLRPTLAADSFQGFLNGVRTDARKQGISSATLDAAFRGIAPNQKVLERDRHQPEFTMTWDRYRALVINDQRVVNGREAWKQNRALLGQVQSRYGVDPRIILGIWGLESSFGTTIGSFNVIEALATLAWEGRRASFFRAELLAALKILEAGDISPARMTGSYAGAMGQPQFMPTSFVRYAVDFDGDGKRDIWNDRADVFGSIANYLAKSGWRGGEIWGVRAVVAQNFDASLAGREFRRSPPEWSRLGVRADARAWPGADAPAALVLPDSVNGGDTGDAFLVGANFFAIRRYNPSDFYALGVALLGDLVTT